MPEKIYLILREARIKNGLSQKDLGDLVGLPQQAINRLEQGQRKIDAELLIKMCDILNISKIGKFSVNLIKDYYSQSDSVSSETSSYSEEDSYLLNCYNKLNKTGKQKAIEHVEMLTKIPEYKKTPGSYQANFRVGDTTYSVDISDLIRSSEED